MYAVALWRAAVEFGLQSGLRRGWAGLRAGAEVLARPAKETFVCRCVGLIGIETERIRDLQGSVNFECSREGLGAIARL